MYVLTTAGHVDHGKSTLIERLTGIDPDRLSEEKARGMTIDLGFAWFTLPSGRDAGIVDVPGHERFVHNMLAGAGSVDSAIFVVAADDGWMPQSEEHLEILELAGARRGVVALTKADLVDAESLGLARDDIRERLAGTVLAGAEIVPVSGTRGDGCDELVAAIDRMLVAPALDEGRPRVFVDRAFTIKGSGTVVTGTLTGGRLRVGDEVVVMPRGIRARVRDIQAHKAHRDEVEPVTRVALNLGGVSRDDVARGDAVVLPGAWRAASVLDVSLRTVRSLDHAFSGRGAFKAYIGSAEIAARVSLYGIRSLGRSEHAFARVTLDAPVTAAPGDRVVLRDVGRDRTVAGGEILDAHAPALRGIARAERPAQLRARAAASRATLPDVIVAERGVVARDDLAWLSGSNAAPSGAVGLPGYVVSPARLAAMQRAIEDALAEHHRREPLSAGMQRDALREAARISDAKLFAEILEHQPGNAVPERALVRLRSHAVAIDETDAARVVRALEDAGFQPPSIPALYEEHGEKLVRALIGSGGLVKISDDLVFTAGQLADVRARITDAVATEGPLTATRIKDLLGTSRKYAIPLLEYLDATGFTRRDGDLRTVR